MIGIKNKQEENFYFQQNLILRREHFGILALMGDGRRYLFRDCYFDFLKYLHHNHLLKGGITEDKKVVSFLNFLLEKKIIGLTKTDARVRFIENDFISEDCISFPRTVYWECTQVCNFKCIHCYSSSDSKARKDEMSFEQAESFVNELSVMGTEFLSIGGGEPFLYPYLERIIKHATENFISIEVSTNGSLATDKKIDDLRSAGLKFVQVSLDGAEADTYVKIRKGGNFSLVTENIRKLSESFTVSTCMVVNKLNVQEIDRVIDLSIKLGAKFFRLIPFMQVGRASDMGRLQLDKKELQGIYKGILEKRKEVGNKIFIQLNENLIIPDRKSIEWMPNIHYGCSAGRTTCGIDSYGNVYPCSYMVFDELKCGNVTKSSLREIWTNSEVLNGLRGISSLKGKCSDCEYLKLCRGGCRAAAYVKSHDLCDSDHLCSVK